MVLNDKEFNTQINDLKNDIKGFEKINFDVSGKEFKSIENHPKVENNNTEKSKEREKKKSFFSVKRVIQITSFISILYTLIKKFGKAILNKLLKPLIKGVIKIGTKVIWPIAKGVYKYTLKPIGKAIAKLLPKTASKNITKILAKFATKTAGEVAVKEGAKVIAKEAGKIATKEGVKEAAKVATRLPLGKKLVEKIGEKTLEKTGSKIFGKSIGAVFKKVPVVGLLVGAGFAVNRALKGDYTGAGMELASGALACLPIGGTAASIGMDGAIIARDLAQGR